MNKLKLGVVGMSEGNGHPYSWSAIFNGFNEKEMLKCPFPVIPDYLSNQQFPEDFLADLAEVLAVWTQDKRLSESIASSSYIPVIVDHLEDLSKHVDAVLLARDDGEQHLKMAKSFLEQGKAVFIDKPFALSRLDAEEMIASQKSDWQIFTCSALRYAKEFQSDKLDMSIGEVKSVYASVPKYWETYSVHVIEPAFNILNDWSPIKSRVYRETGKGVIAEIEKESGVFYTFESGREDRGLSLDIEGTKGKQIISFQDSFFAFRESLRAFVQQVNARRNLIPREQSLQIVDIVEGGCT